MCEVVCKPVLNYGAEVWACSIKIDEQRLERIQKRAGRPIPGLHVLAFSWSSSERRIRLEKTEV